MAIVFGERVWVVVMVNIDRRVIPGVVIEGNTEIRGAADLYQPGRSPSQLNLRLGQLTLEAHGFKAEAAQSGVVIHHTYTSAGFDTSGRLIQIQIAPWPEFDFYQAYYAQCVAGANDIVLSLVSQPGMQAYHRSIGLIDASTRIFELDPVGDKLGFPHTDPLALAVIRHDLPLKDRLFVSTLPTPFTAAAAKRLGMNAVQEVDSVVANDKGLFQQAAAKFGYPVFESIELHRESQIGDVARAWGQSPHGVVVRLSRGAGGDTAIFCAGTEAGLRKALSDLRVRCEAAYNSASFDHDSLESFWPTGAVLPTGSQVSVSRHAKDYGEILLNGSLSMVVDKGGGYRVGSFYSQVTNSDGAFLGSASVSLKPEITGQISRSLKGIAAYCESLKLFGLVGVDFMLVRCPDGATRLFFYEVNGRPSSSAMAELVCQKLGGKSFLQGVVKAANPITTFEEGRNCLNSIGHDLLGGSSDGARIVILALTSCWRNGANGLELMHPSNAVKLMAVGPDSESCRRLFERLKLGGLKFN